MWNTRDERKADMEWVEIRKKVDKEASRRTDGWGGGQEVAAGREAGRVVQMGLGQHCDQDGGGQGAPEGGHGQEGQNKLARRPQGRRNKARRGKKAWWTCAHAGRRPGWTCARPGRSRTGAS